MTIYQPARKSLLRYLQSCTTKDLYRVCNLVGRIIKTRNKARSTAARQALEPKPLTPKQIYHKWRSEEGRKKARAAKTRTQAVSLQQDVALVV